MPPLAAPRTASALALAALAPGCATTGTRPTETAKRDAQYNGSIDRLLLVFESNDLSAAYLGKEFQPRVAAQLGELLKPRGVATESMTLSGEDLDPNKPVGATATRVRATHVLHVTLTGVLSRTKTDASYFQGMPPWRWVEDLKFSFQLHDVLVGKIVWRGELKYPDPPSPEALAAKFVESLGSERFLQTGH